ncbi:hypothetical protein H109_04488 [Trichophyton interdigitale MR816]|uniref:Uncharacterized protein n=1 Tax=Trichophyton interdigitale (strain MR816) TaxID=1215338 RepID=A0A059J6W8_TRIIM|nr:hypothetical protein H101_00629 [Trichophyton interdigitale H6]KDB23595.1 hypothetical protein H109_04488 [Trichophyton interdigitale MR816]
MGNTQSKQHQNRLSRPLSAAALASSTSLVAAEAAGAPESLGKTSQDVPNKSPAEGQPAPQPQPCQCQWCIDYAVPDPYQTPSTPLEEFFEFRRQLLSRMGAKNSASPASSGASPVVEEDSRSPVSTKMDGFKRRFSRSKSNFQRRLSLTSNGDNNAASAAINPLRAPPDPAAPALVGLGLVGSGSHAATAVGGHHGDTDAPVPSPQNPPSGQPRLVSARRRSFNIPTRFPLFSKSRQHTSHQDDSVFHYKSNTEPLRRSWTDVGAATDTAATTTTSAAYSRLRSASPARAISPSEQGYTHLGTFKFGSLHVVNGCASPAPSSKKQRSYPDLNAIEPLDSKPETETEQEQEPLPEMETVMARAEEPVTMPAIATPPPIPKRSSSRLNIHRSEGAVEAQHLPEPATQPSLRSKPKLTPLVTSRRPSVSWFDDCPTSPAGFGSPDSAHLRPLTPPFVQPTPMLVTTTKQTEHDDNLFEDEGMEIPVFWDDTVQSHESFHDPHFHSSLSKERQEAKKVESGKRSGALNKTDSGYSSASGKSASRHRYTSSRQRNSRDRNGRLFDEDSNQALIHCDGSINDPVEGTISISSHGDKEIINAVFPWPPAHLRYPVEPYTSQEIQPKQPPQEPTHENKADSMSEYNLDPTYPVRAKFEPSRPPPIPPRFRQPMQVSRPRPADSQHTQCKIPSPVGLAIEISPKCISPRDPSPKDRTHRSSNNERSSRSHARGHAKGGSYKSYSSKEHTTKSHSSASNTNKSNTPKSSTTKRPNRRYRDSTPARMTGGKPPTASQVHARSASDATSSRPSKGINKDKPLPALPPTGAPRFPKAQMLTPPLSRSTSMGDLKLLTNTSPADLINYIDSHTPVEIDNNLWGSLSADPELDLELLPLNLDLNKSALDDYQPRKSLQESIHQSTSTTRQPNKLHRSASHFSFSSSINQKPSGRYSTFPPSPVRDVFFDRKSRKAKYQSTPPTSYRFSQLKSTVTEKRSSHLPSAPSTTCAAQMALAHQKPGALNHIESYL